MPINKETIISVFEDKLTLMQWLKTINKALEDAVLTGVEVRQKGNATFSFVVTFEDGTELESNEFVLAQGESIKSATIRNGHLYLTLTNDDELDAGNVKPVSSFSFNSERHLIVYYGDGTNQDLGLIKGLTGFHINESQHLIVTYDNGTTEDLGAIFQGNVNVDGNFTANSIIENMSGYSFELAGDSGITITPIYAGVVKNGNKLTCSYFAKVVKTSAVTQASLGRFNIPRSVADKLIPTQVGVYSWLDLKEVAFYSGSGAPKILDTQLGKRTSTQLSFGTNDLALLDLDTDYFFRYEVTFLLSNSLISN